MNDAPMEGRADGAVETALRDELARGEAMLSRSRSVLLHLLNIDGQELFSDEVVAGVRGMSLDVASQLLTAEGAGGQQTPRQDALAQALLEDPAFLAHAHALALEGQLAERLQAQGGIDPVNPPLVQDLLAAEKPETAGLAMAVLAAQARFRQHYRRMELPVAELPGDLFHKALVLLRSHGEGAGPGEAKLRAAYHEGASRLSLLSHLFVSLGDEESRAMSLDQAGVAIFATALAQNSGQDRGLMVISMADAQPARLSLALRAAGLGPDEVQNQLLSLHFQGRIPHGLETLTAESAAALMSVSAASAVS